MHKRKLRRAGRRAKPGARTSGGQLSRAATAAADLGSRDAERHRLALINGADPVLAGAAITILLANGHLTREQVRAGEHYASLRAILFGVARPSVVHDQVEPHDPRLRTDGHLMRVRARFEAMAARLDPEQKAALDQVTVDGKLPVWFRLAKTRRPLRSVDERERLALVSGLDAIADR